MHFTAAHFVLWGRLLIFSLFVFFIYDLDHNVELVCAVLNSNYIILCHHAKYTVYYTVHSDQFIIIIFIILFRRDALNWSKVTKQILYF